MGDALRDSWTLVLQRLLQLAYGLLRVVFGVGYVIFEFVERLALLLYQFVKVLEYLVNISYTCGDIINLFSSLIHSVLKLRYLL